MTGFTVCIYGCETRPFRATDGWVPAAFHHRCFRRIGRTMTRCVVMYWALAVVLGIACGGLAECFTWVPLVFLFALRMGRRSDVALRLWPGAKMWNLKDWPLKIVRVQAAFRREGCGFEAFHHRSPLPLGNLPFAPSYVLENMARCYFVNKESKNK